MDKNKVAYGKKGLYFNLPNSYIATSSNSYVLIRFQRVYVYTKLVLV